MERILEQTQFLPVTLTEAWNFFSNPSNLDAITPPELRFKIVDLDGESMYSGQIIRYRIRVAPLLWTGWTTEILDVVPGVSFTDSQVKGPYKKWIHEHRFRDAGDRGVEMNDRITYEVGFGVFGELAHVAFVGGRLRRIFDYRRRKLVEMFSS